MCNSPVSPVLFFLNIDIKHVYMIGDKGELEENSLDGIRNKRRYVFKRGVNSCTRNHFVVVKAGSRQALQITRGSGMGLI